MNARRSRRGRGTSVQLLGLALLASCAQPPSDGFDDVAALAEQRLGQPASWARRDDQAAEREAAIDALLAHELSVDDAVRVALLSNRSLQARFEDLGVAEAERIQAGLLANPTLSVRVRSSNRSGDVTNTEFSLVQDLLDVFVRPAREELAQAQEREAVLRAAESVLELAADTRKAYYALQGALHEAALMDGVVESAAAAAEFARRQHEAGNIAALDLAAQRASSEQVRVDAVAVELAALERREELAVLMGLWGARLAFTLPARLPDLPAPEAGLEHAESLAMSQRPELEALRWEIEALARAHAIAVDWRWVPLLELGVSAEQDTDGARVLGPELSIALPVFDRGQAAMARAEALLSRAEQQLVARAVEIRSEVRRARNRMLAARAVAEHHRLILVPLRAQVVAETRRMQAYMLAGVYELLSARRDEIDAWRGSVAALRDYWVARSELERALGGPLDGAAGGMPSMSGPPDTPGMPDTPVAPPGSSAEAQPVTPAPEAAPVEPHHHAHGG